MPAAASNRDPYALLALTLSKGEQTLASLARLAHGEILDDGEAERLRRIGLIEAGPPRLAPHLFTPILALEAALGLAGDDLLNQLLGLLQGAGTRAARDSLLIALAEELHRHLDLLDEGHPLDDHVLQPILQDLTQIVARLKAAEADPVLVTRVAELTARLVERLARHLRIGRRAAKKKEALPDLPIPSLAAALGEVRIHLPQALPVPSAQALARALADPEYAASPERRVHMDPSDGRAERRIHVGAALSASDPVIGLYLGQPVPEALRRHNTLVGLGREALEEAALAPTSEAVQGPEPLAWSTRIRTLSKNAEQRVA
jgi:hypothetical protein